MQKVLFSILFSFAITGAWKATATTLANSTPQSAKVLTGGISGSSASWVDVTFTSSNAVYETFSGMVGTNVIAAKATGQHMITVFGAGDGTFMGLRYRVNAGSWTVLCYGVGMTGIYPHCSGSDQLQLNDGDTIQFQVHTDADPTDPVRIGLTSIN